MSVPSSKRGESQLELISLAHTLAAHTIKICSNEKNFPKRYRWCITAKIVDTAIEIVKLINIANSIYVTDKGTFEMRKKYQAKALAETYALTTLMQIGYEVCGIDSRKMDFWTGLVSKERNLIRAWKKADENRYSIAPPTNY